jgi:hypothetical protein
MNHSQRELANYSAEVSPGGDLCEIGIWVDDGGEDVSGGMLERVDWAFAVSAKGAEGTL